jgi:hypothetical protein
MWAVGNPIGKTGSNRRAIRRSNMRRVTVLLAGTAIAFGLGATAFAETSPGNKASGERLRTQFLERLDADKDGIACEQH